MPLRKTILATNEVYHIFNRSIQNLQIFKGRRECEIFLKSAKFYLQPKPPIRFSVYRKSPGSFPIDLKERLVCLFCYCLMPNHFHFLLRQEKENGITKFLQRLLNSFSHYFSVKYKNRGSLFEGNFKAVRVENDEQLIHLSRYIHLNPVTSYLVENPQDYPFSSYRYYINQEFADYIDSSLILGLFPSRSKYQEFVMNQKEYQRELDKIKHLIIE